MGVKEVVEYLVKQRLVGDNIALFCIKEYIVDDVSPSDVGHKYRVSKYVVRGYVRRVLEKLGYRYDVARKVVSAVFPVILDTVSPVIIRIDGQYYCLLCDKYLPNKDQAIKHIKYKHPTILKDITSKVLWALTR